MQYIIKLDVRIYGLKIDYMNLQFLKALKKKSGVLIYQQIKYNIFKAITLKGTLGLIGTQIYHFFLLN